MTTIGVLANTLMTVLIPESPTWHLARNEHDEANKIYSQIARFNGTVYNSSIFVTDLKGGNDL